MVEGLTRALALPACALADRLLTGGNGPGMARRAATTAHQIFWETKAAA
ncbi:MAG: hypothetical protein M3R63_14375 [Actinomycetota bacterium]|nr:hypothetical protein [Actinomycetota bacterium]